MNLMGFRSVRALMVGVFVVTAATAHAQADGTTAGGAGGQCAPVATDTARGFVYGILEPESRDAKLPDATLVAVLAGISAALINDTLTLDPVAQLHDVVVTAYRRTRDSRPMMMPRWSGHPALMTEIAVTLNTEGALVDPEIIFEGDSTVARLLRRRIAGTPSIPAARPDRPQRLRLRLTLTPESLSASTPFIAARQLRVDGTPPRAVSGIGAPLAPSGSRGGMAATILVWFIIDARGSAVPASIVAAPPADRLDAGRYRAFVDAVVRAIPRMRFLPATVGGCPTERRSALTVRFSPSSQSSRRTP